MLCMFQSMTRQLISLIRDATVRETGRQQADQRSHKDLPGRSSDAQQRGGGGEGLIGVTSQLALQKDVIISPALPPLALSSHHDDDDLHSAIRTGQGQGQVCRPRLFPVRCNRVEPVDDADERQERRRQRRKHRKHRRHRHEQQALVDSATPTSGHQTT